MLAGIAVTGLVMGAAIAACGPPPVGWLGAGRNQTLPAPQPEAGPTTLPSNDSGEGDTGDDTSGSDDTGDDSGSDADDSGSDSGMDTGPDDANDDVKDAGKDAGMDADSGP